MFFKFQTVVTAFKKNDKAFVLLESLVAFSLVTVMVLYLLPSLSQSLLKISEGKEQIEMMRLMYEYSHFDENISEEAHLVNHSFNIDKKEGIISISNHDKSLQESLHLESVR